MNTCKFSRPFVDPAVYPKQGYACTVSRPMGIMRCHNYCRMDKPSECPFYEEKEKLNGLPA